MWNKKLQRAFFEVHCFHRISLWFNGQVINYLFKWFLKSSKNHSVVKKVLS